MNEKWATTRFCIENHIFSLALDVLRSFLLPSRASRYLSRAAAPVRRLGPAQSPAASVRRPRCACGPPHEGLAAGGAVVLDGAIPDGQHASANKHELLSSLMRRLAST